MRDSTPCVGRIATVLRRICDAGIESAYLMSPSTSLSVSHAATNSPRFRVWIRRETQSEGQFSIRFSVEDGKGLLRVARPGVLIDPPAHPSGAESRLTGAQLRASRFLHVWDSGRSRQGYTLTRMDEPSLDRAPDDRWVELLVTDGGVLCYLSLPDVMPESPESPESEGEIEDHPTSPREELDSLPVDAGGLGGAAAPAREPLRFTALSLSTTMQDEAAQLQRVVETVIPQPVVAAQRVESPHELSAPLVRHLRRQLARQGARVLELEEEIRRLRVLYGR